MVESTDKIMSEISEELKKVEAKPMEIITKTKELLDSDPGEVGKKIKKEIDTNKDGVISTEELKNSLKNSNTLRILLGGFLTIVLTTVIGFINKSIGGTWNWSELLTILQAVLPIGIIIKIFMGMFTGNETTIKKQEEEISALNNVVTIKDQEYNGEIQRLKMEHTIEVGKIKADYEAKLADKELTNRLLIQKIELQITK